MRHPETQLNRLSAQSLRGRVSLEIAGKRFGLLGVAHKVAE